MAAQSIWKHVPHGLLVFAVLVMSGSEPVAAAELPTSPGLGFAMVGIASGQTARVTALNVGPGGPALPTGGAPGICGGGITFEFYGADGELLKKKVINNLLPGNAAFLDLTRDELPKGAARTEVRAVLRFGYNRGYPPDHDTRARFECNILPSLQIWDNLSGKTISVLTDARPLPESNIPRR